MYYELGAIECQNIAVSARKEWLLTDGHGGYAMGTPSGINSRRYHGHWVPAILPPIDRMVLLSNVEAKVVFDQEPIDLSSNQYVGTIHPDGFRRLHRFNAGANIEWLYTVGPGAIKKRLSLSPEGVTISYENRTPRRIQLTLMPLVCHKPYHQNFRFQDGYPASLEFDKDVTRLVHHDITLALGHKEAQRFPVAGWYYRFEQAREVERGLDPIDDLFCPCELRYELAAGEIAYLTAGLGTPPEVFETPGSGLDMWQAASKHFLVKGTSRPTIVAGYPWFGDWGRDTMIALPGICLLDGKFDDARQTLLAYASQMFQGLIPNRFVEDHEEPEYNTVDATLWFANAIYQTLQAEWDWSFAEKMFAVLQDVIEWHTKGTLYGIVVDAADGLLTQGEEGLQLTWMDAKIGDWVVSPRHGKPIEINGLWINLLRVCCWLGEKLNQDVKQFEELASRAEVSFEAKFWSEHHKHYFDTIEPFDAQLRPNQVIAMALPFSPCSREKATIALQTVSDQLVTPYGLRTLGPHEIHYHGRYEGKLIELDAAYHQGTVWPWLMGSYVEAMIKFDQNLDAVQTYLDDAEQMLSQGGFGGVAEVYDGDSPQCPGGCPWQAWSVGEFRRARKMLSDSKGKSS